MSDAWTSGEWSCADYVEGTVPDPGRPLRARILVVEDDPTIGEQLEAVLRDEGFDVERAADGSQALQLLRTNAEPPDLILLDLIMPEMNGWEFRREQMVDDRIRQVPVVVMTAVPSSASREDFGPVAVLAKPLRLERLLGAVCAAIPRT